MENVQAKKTYGLKHDNYPNLNSKIPDLFSMFLLEPIFPVYRASVFNKTH